MITYDFLKQKSGGRSIFPVTFQDLGLEENRPEWQMEFIIPGIIAYAKDIGVDITICLCYHDKKYVFITEEFAVADKKFCIPIPYHRREDYDQFIIDINCAVSLDGCVSLAVCNNPYDFHCYLIVECDDTEADTIKQIVSRYGLSITYEKGMEEIFKDIAVGGFWKFSTLVPNSPDLAIFLYHSLFQFPSEKELEEVGIHSHNNKKRKKVFVSYCHKDKEIVRPIVDEMNESGINAWLDAKEIDIGDDILEEILLAFEKCDLAILFLSQNYKDSYYAKFELRNFLDSVIRNKKRIFPVLIDDVDPDDIYMGLHRYNYFRLEENTTDILIEKLKIAIQKLDAIS